MHLLQNVGRHCPYCGELIDFLVDCSVAEQEYTEDCFVCCRPIIVNVEIDQSQNITLCIRREDE